MLGTAAPWAILPRVFALMLSCFNGVRQTVELASPHPELLFHFRIKSDCGEQATSLGLFTEMSGVHGRTPPSVVRPYRSQRASSRIVCFHAFTANPVGNTRPLLSTRLSRFVLWTAFALWTA
jgi:hypothetical protein